MVGLHRSGGRSSVNRNGNLYPTRLRPPTDPIEAVGLISQLSAGTGLSSSPKGTTSLARPRSVAAWFTESQVSSDRRCRTAAARIDSSWWSFINRGSRNLCKRFSEDLHTRTMSIPMPVFGESFASSRRSAPETSKRRSVPLFQTY